MAKFESTAKYKLIYIFEVHDENHKGLLKIGDATIDCKDPSLLVPNCKALNDAAKARINSYTQTAGIAYHLLYTELALKKVNFGEMVALASFKDTDVHDVLQNSGKRKVQPGGTNSRDWLEVDLETAKNAIKAVKEGRKSLTSNEITNNAPTIVLRDEQNDAIEKTIERFKKHNEMLWYAKMRFGKTLTSLEVVRRSHFRRVIIVTHRPVVGGGWQEDFHKIFRQGEDPYNYSFEFKANSANADDYDEHIDTANDMNLRNLDKNGCHFIYFASIQDLRGSQRVSGKFNKNNAVFDLEWDLIIIDEAHEGTQTELGDNVIKELRKENTKVLALSGTPFNILDQYEDDSVYTWDYVMEQKRKEEWDTLHPGDHNPYADLPKMHIFTYNLGENIPGYVEHELEGKAFNFREFFRTYTGDEKADKGGIPAGKKVGDFIHESDVRSFLGLITKPDSESLYPYSNDEYRAMFKHTLWMVPGVKEAKALSKLLREHPVFSHFGIANVAGEGDDFEKEHSEDALDLVRNTIKNNDYSITLSCGKLTTGVTVKEWTAVFMLAGSYSTAAAGYMQTIFRVQSAGQIDGKQKTDCYVFDFAPDRTLKVLAETANISRKAGRAGKSQEEHRDAMNDFINFCPVIAIEGTEMKPYSVNTMMEQLKRVYAEKAIKNGFDDASIYNDNLMRLDDMDLEKFKTLKGIVGSSKAAPPLNDVEVNAQGFDEEEYKKAEEAKKKPKKERTPEQEELLKKLQEQRKNRNNAISILRGVSIRMPLMIYGANVPFDEDISIERFVEMVDEESWKEFMPNGVTKTIFKDFLKYYDRDVFISAGKEIRKLAASADELTPTERVKAVSRIFRYFKNPDKETVLTPWRVVNMHMSDCMGGWCFYGEDFETILEEPRFVDRGQVTKDTFGNPNAQILEINSKSGLYPLYVAYSIYRAKLGDRVESEMDIAELNKLWYEAVSENVFVICKTPMAKSITRRTLLGYQNSAYNAHYFDDLINMLKNKPEQFKKRILKGSYWKKEVTEMKFDAVVGNPPYQDSTSVNNRDSAVYPYFYDAAENIAPKYSLISPARFLFNTGLTSKEWNRKMLSNPHFKVVRFEQDATNIFPNTDIKGGVAITFFNKDEDFGAIDEFIPDEEIRSIASHFENNPEANLSSIVFSGRSDLKFTEKFITKYPQSIRDRIVAIQKTHPDVKALSPNEEYELKSSTFEVLPYIFKDNEPENPSEYYKILGLVASKRCYKWIEKEYMVPRYETNNIGAFKVLLPESNGAGKFGETLSTPLVVGPDVSSTPTFIGVGNFSTLQEAENLLKYLSTKFARALLGILKKTQHNPSSVWGYIPLQDFTTTSDIIWNQSVEDIDKQLYTKYNFSSNEIDFIEANVFPMNISISNADD